MQVLNFFNKLADIDMSSNEYLNFSNALIDAAHDITDLTESDTRLSYAPGFTFNNIPFVNNHPGFKNKWGNDNNSDTNKNQKIVDVRKHSLAFFEMIERLVSNHRVIRSEVLMELPAKEINYYDEIKRIHIDTKVFHRYAKRCQIAIATNKNCFLNVEHNRLSMPIGTIYEFNNKECHWGVNYGDTIRIIVILDMVDLNVWNNLNPIIRNNFFEQDSMEIITQERQRYAKFISEFKAKHNL